MLKEILALICLMSLACGEMPVVGDYVAIIQSAGSLEKYTSGWVTEINMSAGLATLHPDIILYRSGFSVWRGAGNYTPDELSLGLSTITSLQISPTNKTPDIYQEFCRDTAETFPQPTDPAPSRTD
jgi:hypothetical protein